MAAPADTDPRPEGQAPDVQTRIVQSVVRVGDVTVQCDYSCDQDGGERWYLSLITSPERFASSLEQEAVTRASRGRQRRSYPDRERAEEAAARYALAVGELRLRQQQLLADTVAVFAASVRERDEPAPGPTPPVQETPAFPPAPYADSSHPFPPPYGGQQ